MKRGCTQCGECLNVCPVFQEHKREEFSPKAKRLLLEPVAAAGSAGDPGLAWDEIKDLARLCAGCGKCKQACARKLSTADLLADVRAGHPHWTQQLWELWIRRMGPLWPTLGRIASLVPASVTPPPLKTSLATAGAMANPTPPAPWVSIRRGPEAVVDTTTPVLLFSGCTAHNVRPQWKKKAEQLLRAWGYTLLDASGFTCCGGTLHHAGQYTGMNSVQKQNVTWWTRMGKPRIAAFCASCHHGLAEYDEVLQGDGSAWKKALTPLTSLLAGAIAVPTLHAPATWGYHQPCHWGTHDTDLPFLTSLLNGMVKGNGLCCGMGGILKMTDPGISDSMARRCLAGFPAGVDSILTGCSGCTLQLNACAAGSTQVHHWLDVVTA